MPINDDMADAFIAHAIDLSKIEASAVPKVMAHLEMMREEIHGVLSKDLVGMVTPGQGLNPTTKAKLEALLQQVDETISSSFDKGGIELKDQMIEVAQWDADRLPQMMNDVFSADGVISTALTPKQLEKIVTTSLVEGMPAAYWWDKQTQKTKDVFQQQVKVGLLSGESTDKITQRIVGDRVGWKTIQLKSGKKKRVGVYSGGVLDVSRREAEALVLTSIAKASNDTQEAVFKENDDVLKGRAAHVTLDTRTSTICQGRSGGAWDFEGKPLPQSRIQIPYPGPPPWHFRCRTIVIPITKSWEELSGERFVGLPEFSPSTQASMDGQVAGDLNYEDWFKGQVGKKGDAWGERVMGKTKYGLWKSGKLTMSEMVDFSGNPISVAELRKMANTPKAAGKIDAAGLSVMTPLTQPQLDKFNAKRKTWQQTERQDIAKFRDSAADQKAVEDSLAAGEMPKGRKSMVMALDKATSTDIGEDVTLWNFPKKGIDLSNLKPGDVVNQTGFTSATSNTDRVKRQLLGDPGDVIYKINARAGNKGAFIEGPDQNEARFALARNTKLKVKGIQEVEVEIPEQYIDNGSLKTKITTKKVKVVEFDIDGVAETPKVITPQPPQPTPPPPKPTPTPPEPPKPAPTSSKPLEPLPKVSQLTNEERDAILEYQNGLSGSKYGGYSVIQGHLRDPTANKILGVVIDKPGVQKVVANLDSALEKSQDAKGKVLYRGVSNSTGWTGVKITDLKPGYEFSDKGYTSTSSNLSVVKNKFANKLNMSDKPVIFTITGADHSLDMSKISTDTSEKEFVLPRNSRFRVISVKAGPTYQVKLEVVHDKSTPVAPKPPPPVSKADSLFPGENEALTVVKKLGGSTGAELVQDSQGRRFVRKYGKDQGHLEEEWNAEEAYRAAGAVIPNSKLFTDASGKKYKLAEFIDGKALGELRGAERTKAEEELRKHFAADALFGNWDVVGMSFDNVLVTPDGKTYRIDVGGSMRYRAQGALKTKDQWNDHPVDLWNMRDPKTSPQVAQVMSPLTHDKIVSQAQTLLDKKEAILASVPSELRATLDGRFKAFERMVTTSNDFMKEGFSPDYTGKVAMHQMKIRAAGVMDNVSKDTSNVGAARGKLYDENGKQFDNLRGENSVSTKFYDYLKSEGIGADAIDSWADAQGGSSWSSNSQALKAWIVDKMQADPNDFYWLRSYADSRSHLTPTLAKKFDEQISALQAVNYECLMATAMPNVDRTRRVVSVVRTESKDVMKIHGMKVGNEKVMTRGAAESFSLYHRVSVKGAETTVQDIPFSRVVGSYFMNKSSGYRMFLGDDENELVCIARGSKAKYVSTQSWNSKYAKKAGTIPLDKTPIKPGAAKVVGGSSSSYSVSVTIGIDEQELKASWEKCYQAVNVKTGLSWTSYLGLSQEVDAKKIGLVTSQEFKAIKAKYKLDENMDQTSFNKKIGQFLIPKDTFKNIPKTPVKSTTPSKVGTGISAGTSDVKKAKQKIWAGFSNGDWTPNQIDALFANKTVKSIGGLDGLVQKAMDFKTKKSLNSSVESFKGFKLFTGIDLEYSVFKKLIAIGL